MAMLGEKFPRTQFVVTGVLGPHSNAHGPNEFLHIPTGKRVTMAVASIIADHTPFGHLEVKRAPESALLAGSRHVLQHVMHGHYIRTRQQPRNRK